MIFLGHKAMGLEDFSTQKIKNASEIQLESMLQKFKTEHVSIAKLGGFLFYNMLALSGLLGYTSWYINSHRIRKGEPRTLNQKQLTIINIVKKGSKIGTLIGGLYMTGFVIVGYFTMPFSIFKKYCQIQQALHIFQIKYDPFYQQVLLYRKMKKFGLSDSLISEIKVDLNSKKRQLIENNKLKPQTISALIRSQLIFNQLWQVQIKQ